MFADVVGSTAMAEHLDPEQISEIMAGAFEFMNAAVARYGGTVSRLMGDAVLALFGAPHAHEDDPERAVRAALDLLKTAEGYQHTVQRAYGVDFAVRVGLHTGLAVLTTIGDAIKAEYTAMGDTPNVAARVQSAAEPGTVLVTASTMRHIRHLVTWEEREPIRAKGKSEPVEVYVVTGVASETTGKRGIAGLESPLVGREAECEILSGAIRSLGAGRGRLVMLTGEAGLGKSRLVDEARKSAPEDVHWMTGRATSYGQSMVHGVWRDLFRGEIGSSSAEGPGVVRNHMRERAEALGLDPGGLAAIEALLDAKSEASAKMIAQLDQDSFRDLLVGTLRSWIVAASGSHGCVVVFEDLHWADEASVDLVEGVADIAREHAVTIIATMRPDKGSHGWAGFERLRTQYEDLEHIALRPLDSASSRQLLDNLLQIENLPAAIRDNVLKRSDGNPFFVEEVLRSLIDAGHVYLEDGTWRAHPDIEQVTIPETLAGVLTSRIDRLSDQPKRVIQIASVIGRNFPYPVLKSLCASTEEADPIPDPSGDVGTLTEEGLVRELARHIDYAFKHALTQEAAYELLLLRRRRDLHRRTGHALEQYYRDHVEEVAGVLAHHFFEGEEWRTAHDYAMEGAHQAQQVFRGSQALELFDLAIEANERDPAPPPSDVCDAILGWAEMAFKVRPREEVLARLQRAEELARALGDERRLAQTLNWIGNAHILSGFPGDAMPALNESFELGKRLGDEQVLLLPLFLTTSFMIDEDPVGALPKLDQVIENARRFKDRDVEVHTLGAKADALARVGHFDEARETIELALELVPSTHSPIKMSDVNSYAASVFMALGEPERAAEHGRVGAELSMSVQGHQCAMSSYLVKGMAEMMCNRPDDAEQSLLAADTLARRYRMGSFANQIRGFRAKIGHSRGEPGVREVLVETVRAAERDGDSWGVAIFSDELGQIDLEEGRYTEAAAHLERALDYYRRAQMRPSLDRALELLEEARRGAGDEASAARARQERLAAQQTPPA